jgi:hypothetical protein
MSIEIVKKRIEIALSPVEMYGYYKLGEAIGEARTRYWEANLRLIQQQIKIKEAQVKKMAEHTTKITGKYVDCYFFDDGLMPKEEVYVRRIFARLEKSLAKFPIPKIKFLYTIRRNSFLNEGVINPEEANIIYKLPDYSIQDDFNYKMLVDDYAKFIAKTIPKSIYFYLWRKEKELGSEIKNIKKYRERIVKILTLYISTKPNPMLVEAAKKIINLSSIFPKKKNGERNEKI